MDHKLKILHLEDLQSHSELVTRQLNKANMQFENLVVDTKTGFMAALQQFAPDIILADHFLSSFNSMEALKIVKENKKDIPFLLVANTASDELVNSMMKEGAKGYILKDNLDSLPEVIRDAMDKVLLKVQDYPVTEVILPEEKLYDLRMLEEMDDNDYLVEIISIFLNETPKELKELYKAAANKKTGIVAGKAHKLKSNTGLLEATRLTNILTQIEIMASSGNQQEQLIGLADTAITEYKKIETSLKKYLKSV